MRDKKTCGVCDVRVRIQRMSQTKTVASTLFCCLLTVSSGALWCQTWSSKGPLPRSEHSAVLDPVTNRMIVFGGGLGQVPATDTNDVWRLNGATAAGSPMWIAVKPTGTAPAPREGHTAVYAGTNNIMIVFGGGLGSTSPRVNDVWILENANGSTGNPAWVQLSPSGGPPAARVAHSAVYDSQTDTMIVYGGDDCFSTSFGDVWVLSHASGTGGAPAWAQLLPSGTSPAPRNGHVATYDSSTNTMTIFGGHDTATNTDFNEVWVLSNANGTGGTPAWTQLTPSGPTPAPRQAASGVYNSASNRMTIFGGETSTGSQFNDVWILSSANGSGGSPQWTELAPLGKKPPAPRSGHTAVFNSASDVMTVFGGTDPAAANDLFILTKADGL